MKFDRDSFLIVLLVIALGIQIYITFFKDPVALSQKGLVESKILLQGRDPGVPPPTPGKEPELDQKITVQKIGPEPRPVVVPGVTYGEGQSAPKVPLSALPKGPMEENMPKDMEKFSFSLEKNEDFFKFVLYGIAILQQNKEVALTPSQAKRLKKIFDRQYKVRDAVPKAQKVILETLTDRQLKYIYIQKCRKQGGSNPLPPEYIEKKAVELEKLLRRKMNE